MEDQKYCDLLRYLKKKEHTSSINTIWAKQFSEKNNHIYKGERRVILRSEVTWIISMFHDDPTAAYQGTDAVYQHISKRYIWESMKKDIGEYVKTYREC